MESQIFTLAKEIQLSDNGNNTTTGKIFPEAERVSERRKRTEHPPDFPSVETLADLIRRSCCGDATAMEAIYLRFKNALFGLAYRYTYDRTAAEDLLQEIFLKIFTHIKDVRRVETFVGWIYRIALNTCYSYLREKRIELRKFVPLGEVEGILREETRDSSDVAVKKSLEEAIARMPEKLKRIFLLHDVQGFKHHEIARMLGLSVGTSKSQLFKARMKVREYLINRQIV
ncbi:MAG: RNA polymerase sigma factor [Candidatus Aminicenantales bacterium]